MLDKIIKQKDDIMKQIKEKDRKTITFGTVKYDDIEYANLQPKEYKISVNKTLNSTTPKWVDIDIAPDKPTCITNLKHIIQDLNGLLNKLENSN